MNLRKVNLSTAVIHLLHSSSEMYNQFGSSCISDGSAYKFSDVTVKIFKKFWSIWKCSVIKEAELLLIRQSAENVLCSVALNPYITTYVENNVR